MTNVINQEVDVTSYYFTHGRGFPKRVQVGNTQLEFIETGLRCLVKTGQSFVEIFNMSDGREQYRLKFEPGINNWTLLSRRALV